MKRRLIFPLLILSLALAATPARAERPTEESLLTMLKASGVVETMQAVMSKLTARAGAQLKAKLPNLSDEAARIVNTEMGKGVNAIMREMLAKQMTFYAEHLTQQDVNDLIGIYNSPAWKKQIAVSRQYVNEEYAKLLREDVPRMTQEMLSRILTRLKDEGFLKKKDEGI